MFKGKRYSNPAYEGVGDNVSLTLTPLDTEAGNVMASPTNGYYQQPAPVVKGSSSSSADTPKARRRRKLMIAFLVIGWILAVIFFSLTIWLGVESQRLGENRKNFQALGYAVGAEKSVLLVEDLEKELGYTNYGSIYAGSGYWIESALELQVLGNPQEADRSEMAFTATENNFIVMCGGLDDNNNPQPHCVTYDTLMEEMLPLPSLPVTLSGASAVYDPVLKRVHILGGFTDASATAASLTIYTGNFNVNTGMIDSWTAGLLPDLPNRELDESCAALINGRIFLVGGFNQQDNAINTMYVLNQVSTNSPGSWAPGPSMKNARGAAGCTVFNGKLYVAGGMTKRTGTQQTYSKAVEVFDPASNKWSSLPSLTTPRGEGGLAVINGTNLFAFGGVNADGLVTATEAYSFSSKSWSPRAPLGDPKGAAAYATVNGTVFFIGGSKGCDVGASGDCGEPASANILKFYSVNVPDVFVYLRNKGGDLEEFDLQEIMISQRGSPPGGYEYLGSLYDGSGYWFEKGSMSTYSGAIFGTGTETEQPRSDAATVTVGDKIWIMGGLTMAGSDVVPTSSVLIYDAKLETYSLGPSLPRAIYDAAAVVSQDRYIYVLGGATTYHNDSEPYFYGSNEVYMIDTTQTGSSLQFTTVPQRMQANRVEACATIANGRIYVFGGYDSQGNAITTGEYWDMGGGSWTSLPAVPEGTQRGQLACTTFQGKIYLAGGYESFDLEDNDDTTQLMSFDPAKASSGDLAYKLLSPLPEGRVDFAIFPTADSILIVGGEVAGAADDVPVYTVYEYIVRWGVYTQKQPIEEPMLGASYAMHNGVVYQFGGQLSSTSPIDHDVFALYDTDHPRVYLHRLTHPELASEKEAEFELSMDPTPRFGYKPVALLSAGSGQWTIGPEMTNTTGQPLGLSDHAAVAIGTDIFVVGGRNNDDLMNSDILRYDTITRTWEVWGTWPEPRSRFAWAVVNNNIYVIGGYSDPLGFVPVSTNMVAYYDVYNKEWFNSTLIPSRNDTYLTDSCASAVDNLIVVAGGYDSNFSPTRYLAVFNTDKQTWTEYNNLNTPRGDLMCATVGDNVFIVGGWAQPDGPNTNYVPSNAVESFNVDTRTLKSYPNGLLAGRGDAAVAAMPDGTLLVIGGENPSRDPNDNERPVSFVEQYDPKQDTSVPRAPLNNARFRYAAVRVGESVYVMGGSAACVTNYNTNVSTCPSKTFSTVERFTDIVHPSVWLMYNKNAG